MSAEVVLYPGNWLYNAGVVGFLQVLAEYEPSMEPSWFRDDGTVAFSREVFQRFFAPVPVGSKEIPQVLKYYVDYFVDRMSPKGFQEWLQGKDRKGRPIREKYIKPARSMGDFGYKLVYFWNNFFASRKPFQNLVQQEEWLDLKFAEFLQNIPKLSGGRTCTFCGLPVVEDTPLEDKLVERLVCFQHPHFPELGPSRGEFPNAFWNITHSLAVCPFCVYLMLHRELSFISLSDGTKVFLNAPSFQVMWYLNRLFREVYGREGNVSFREIFGLSLMELALRLQIHLGVWAEMNIEVVIRRGDTVDFFSLPYEVVQLLLDRRIAYLLSEIGETSVLRMVLDGRFREILEVGERLLRIALEEDSSKRGRNEHEEDYIRNYIRLEQNRENLGDFSSRLFSLYALVQERLGGGER